MSETFNTELAVEAEQARQARDGALGVGEVGEVVKVEVVSEHPISVADAMYEPGATFQASEHAVRDALARGLVEKVEPKAKK